MTPCALSEDQIRVQQLSANTAIRAGKVICDQHSKAVAQACCDDLENAKNRHVGYSGKGNIYYCEYSDKGTGDWD